MGPADHLGLAPLSVGSRRGPALTRALLGAQQLTTTPSLPAHGRRLLWEGSPSVGEGLSWEVGASGAPQQLAPCLYTHMRREQLTVGHLCPGWATGPHPHHPPGPDRERV